MGLGADRNERISRYAICGLGRFPIVRGDGGHRRGSDIDRYAAGEQKIMARALLVAGDENTNGQDFELAESQ